MYLRCPLKLKIQKIEILIAMKQFGKRYLSRNLNILAKELASLSFSSSPNKPITVSLDYHRKMVCKEGSNTYKRVSFLGS